MAELSEIEAIEWEAAQWVARRMGDGPFDQAAFDAWASSDPRREQVFDTMWQRVMGAGMDEALGAYGRRRKSRRALLAGGAASLVLLAGVYQAWPSIELSMAQPREYTAGEGTIRMVALDDGSRLTLAGGASVRVRYTAHDRVVELSHGTIFANVTHDERRPFRIDAGDARIVDLGTSFEVERKPSDVLVTVESGSVSLGRSGWFGKRIDLVASQAAVLSEAGLSRVEGPRPDRVARWRSEWVEYDDVPLSQVVQDLESVSPVPIRIAGNKLTELRVSGRIRLVDPIRQIENLSVIHDFAVDRRTDSIVLSVDKPDP